MKEKTKIIIPAAGFGTRVGSPLAKELIPHPKTGLPLIQNAINQALKLDGQIHVITRAEKKPLIDYLSPIPNCQIQVIEPSKEWPDSILKSEPFWNERNILILPDTQWSPEHSILEINQLLEHSPIAAGIFNVKNPSSWGIIDTKSPTYKLCEKIQLHQANEEYWAWGILGFKKEIGIPLFEAILQSTFEHQWIDLKLPYSTHKMDSFEDLTR